MFQQVEDVDVVENKVLLAVVQYGTGWMAVRTQLTEVVDAFEKVIRKGGGGFYFDGKNVSLMANKQIDFIAITVTEKSILTNDCYQL